MKTYHYRLIDNETGSHIEKDITYSSKTEAEISLAKLIRKEFGEPPYEWYITCIYDIEPVEVDSSIP